MENRIRRRHFADADFLRVDDAYICVAMRMTCYVSIALPMYLAGYCRKNCYIVPNGALRSAKEHFKCSLQSVYVAVNELISLDVIYKDKSQRGSDILINPKYIWFGSELARAKAMKEYDKIVELGKSNVTA